MTKNILLQSVNESLIDHLKNVFSKTKDSATGKNTKPGSKLSAVAANSIPPEDHDVSIDVSSGGGSSALPEIVSAILTPRAQTRRYGLLLPHSHLKNHYLVTGGGQSLINNAISVEEITKIFDGLQDAKLVQLNAKTPFSTFASFDKDRTVIIDVPLALSNEIEKAKTDPVALKAALLKAMSHKYYVLTINNDIARKNTQFDSALDLEGKQEAIDLNVIENYPDKATLVAAKNAHSDKFGRGAMIAKTNAMLDDIKHQDNKNTLDASKAKNETELKQASPVRTFLDAIMSNKANKGKTPEETASIIFDKISSTKTYTADDVKAELQKIIDDYGSSIAKAVFDKYK